MRFHEKLAKRMGSMKMRQKLMLSYLLIFLLPVTVIGIYLVRSMIDVALDYTMQIHRSNLVQMKTNIRNVIDKYDLISDEILLDKNLLEFLNRDYADGALTLTERYQMSSLTDQYSAKLIVSSPEARYRIYSDAVSGLSSPLFFHTSEEDLKSDWYNGIVQAQGYNVLGPVFFNQDLNRLEFTLGRVLVSDISHGATNVLRIDIPESSLSEFMKQDQGNEEVYLFNGQDQLISSSANRKYIGKHMSDIPGFTDRMHTDQGQKQSYLIAGLDNNRELKGWRLIVLVSNESILQQMSRVVGRSLTVYVVCFLVAFGLMLFFSKTLSERLKHLVRHMSGVREGRMEVTVTDLHNDEIGELNRSFRKMVDRINTLIHEGYEKEIGIKTLMLQKRDAELHALQSQINPHFLFNTMDAIRMHLIKKGDRETADIIGSFARLFRNSLDWSSNRIPLRQELSFAESYLKIIQFRRGLEYVIEVDERLYEVEVPKFSLQPLVENAIQHGIERVKTAGRIRITGVIDGDRAVLSVIDNGIGMTEEELQRVRGRIERRELGEDGRGVGLINVVERIKSCFGEEYGMELESRHREETRVSLRIPYSSGGMTDV
ncbi:sensor histidine kinase [Gorillibacterium timonense]|uniref:sensor histidine kinase n=1 Tax=Gorillibacterium timonense TaxID=1689269 RepID=UPI00071D7204|nr:sensor histidine kinase [Gorillibacterium timonense]